MLMKDEGLMFLCKLDRITNNIYDRSSDPVDLGSAFQSTFHLFSLEKSHSFDTRDKVRNLAGKGFSWLDRTLNLPMKGKVSKR